ncbi:hypothetical protein RYX36_013289 [Vicia faba]
MSHAYVSKADKPRRSHSQIRHHLSSTATQTAASPSNGAHFLHEAFLTVNATTHISKPPRMPHPTTPQPSVFKSVVLPGRANRPYATVLPPS